MSLRSAALWFFAGVFATVIAQWIISPSGQLPKKSCILTDDAKRGQLWANTCKACHDIDPVEPDVAHAKGGPNLQNVYMSLAGTSPLPDGQQHHPPLVAAREAGITWTDDNLSEYLKGPEAFLVKHTGKHFDQPIYYMNFFIGTDNLEGARRDVIAYLKAIKGHPECD